MNSFFTAVRLEEDLCMGCTNCIKRCPTQAIRVRDSKATIKEEFCISCGECIRTCPYYAKKPIFDSLDKIAEYEYSVALPAPSLYAQFNNLEDINIVLNGLIKIGFDDVFEVSGAAEIVSDLTRRYIKNHKDEFPIISTACPSVTRLIQIRFPNLIDHLLPIIAPIDLAAHLALEKAMKKTGLPADKIGIVFISPCPAKLSAVKDPMGIEKSDVNLVVSMEKVYPKLLAAMKDIKDKDDLEDLTISGKIGISWGGAGGEAGGLLSDNYLAADGIENVIRVLDDLEDEKLSDIEFIELNNCNGGCVGGVLTVENPFLAKVKIKRLRKYMPVAKSHLEEKIEEKDYMYWSKSPKYLPVYQLGENMQESIQLLAQVEGILEKFPDLDCGSCGSPTCRALAEDIVRGEASESDCIHIIRKYIHKLSEDISMIDTHRKGNSNKEL